MPYSHNINHCKYGVAAHKWISRYGQLFHGYQKKAMQVKTNGVRRVRGFDTISAHFFSGKYTGAHGKTTSIK